MAKKKNPWIAGILNAVVPGIGYLYIGKRKIFSYLLISGFILSIIDMIYYEWFPPDTIIGWISTIVLLFAFGYDAYKEK